MDQYFAVILGGDGNEKFRTTVSAFTLEAAVDKAARLAASINAVVELVRCSQPSSRRRCRSASI
jgi:hypothetical protein